MDFKELKSKNEPGILNLHEGHRKRLRKSLVDKGWEETEDYIILEYILSCVIVRKDTNPLAHMLINEFGSLAGVLDAPLEELKNIKGVGERVATYLSSYPYIFKAYKKSKIQTKIDCSNPHNVFENFGNIISHMPNEEFYLICLDSDSKVISSKMIARGTKNEVSVTLKSITETAIRNRASGVILLHNHPNGDCTPSSEDIKITRTILYSLYVSGIYVLDHLITNKNGEYYSMTANNYIDDFKKEANKLLNPNSDGFNAKKPKYEVDGGIKYGNNGKISGSM